MAAIAMYRIKAFEMYEYKHIRVRSLPSDKHCISRSSITNRIFKRYIIDNVRSDATLYLDHFLVQMQFNSQ